MQSAKFNFLLGRYKYDRNAAKTLYSYFYPLIVMNINCNFHNKIDGRDIAHQFFLWLFTYTPDEKIEYPTSWVYNKVYYLALDVLRDNRKRTAAELKASIPENTFIPAYASDLLKSLNPQERQVIFLFYWQSYTFKEIAIKLDLKYAAIKYLHKTAKKKIKKEIIKERTNEGIK